MGRVSGKVALITGAARGQGRAHAVRLAEEGASIVAFDVCENVAGVLYEGPTEADLEETGRLVREQGGNVIVRKGDVRKAEDVTAVVEAGLAEFGYIDVVIANQGVAMAGPSWEISEEDWATVVGINLTGSWRVAKAVIPSMIEAGRGGSIILTTSGLASRAVGYMAHYASTKSGLNGLCRELSVELSPFQIRVNTLQPTAVNTPMMDNEPLYELFTPGMEGQPTEARRAEMLNILRQSNVLDVPWVEAEDMANGALFLASEESKMVTGAPFRVDAGYASR
jgi:SDR family mycofactocin-dependent oxidoreductase